MQPQSPVEIVLRLQESPNEDLDVASAFAKHPDVVRQALLEAVRHVKLRSIEITLLQIENAFRSAVDQPWAEPKILRPVLEACRQGKVKSRPEKLFFEHGKEYGVVLLCLATKSDGHRLFREIDRLKDEELIRLIKHVNNIPKKALILGVVAEFVGTSRMYSFHLLLLY